MDFIYDGNFYFGIFIGGVLTVAMIMWALDAKIARPEDNFVHYQKGEDGLIRTYRAEKTVRDMYDN